MGQAAAERAFSGSLALSGRQAAGLVLNLVGVVAATRLLGPLRFGQSEVVLGLVTYAANFGRLGIDVYLIRHPGELRREQVGVSVGICGGLAVLLAAVFLLGAPLLSSWYRDPELGRWFAAGAAVAPVLLLSGLPVALLDRELAYSRAAAAELAGQVCFWGAALLLLWARPSVGCLIFATLVRAAVVLALASLWAPMTWRPRWCPEEALRQLRFGAGYAASLWVWQLRDLVNPVVVGRLLGSEAVAFVAVAVRLAGTIGFVKGVLWRVGTSYLARLHQDLPKMRAALEQGARVQVLALALAFTAFLAVGREAVTAAMGASWLPALSIFPFVAAGLLVNAAFSLYSSALYVAGRNRDVTAFHAVHVAVFALAAWALTAGLGTPAAYGWAEVAALGTYGVVRHFLRKQLFRVSEGSFLLPAAWGLGVIGFLAALAGAPLGVRLLVWAVGSLPLAALALQDYSAFRLRRTAPAAEEP